jgi:glucose-6-phosphate isomerase
MAPISLQSLFAETPNRFEIFSVEAAGLLLDFSRNHLTDHTLDLLTALATEMEVPAAIHQLLTGSLYQGNAKVGVHHAQWRAAEHALLAAPPHAVTQTFAQLCAFVEQVHRGELRGFTQRPIQTVINIGIGGSHLGPQLVTEALKPYHVSAVSVQFWANVDGAAIAEVLQDQDPETTLFIVASKSFTTEETLFNATLAKQWLNQALGSSHAFCQQMVGVSANLEAAAAFGLRPEYCFKVPPEVGGRYSVWSAMGLAPLLAVGVTHFRQLLAGAAALDAHFHQAPLDQNMPVILALLSVWYRNFFHTQAHGILPYDHRLKLLPAHVQQLEMESNGKQVDQAGRPIIHPTAPLIWGDLGSLGQHSFYQWLHQGTDLTPCDFIMPVLGDAPMEQYRDWLFANCLAQSLIFWQGNSADEQAGHEQIPGNRPCSLLLFPRLTPQILGALIALYEHKVFVEGVIWGINSFDQWGIELGKKTAREIFAHLQSSSPTSHHPSLDGLMAYYRRVKDTA